MTKIITVSLREQKIVPATERGEMTKFLQMAHCVDECHNSMDEHFYIILFDITSIKGDRIPQGGNSRTIFALGLSPIRSSCSEQRLE